MMSAAMSRRARQLADQRESFVTATVVRAQRPTSVEAGNMAIVLGDGTIEGFVGGECAGHSVRLYSLLALQSDEPVLLRILPDPVEGDVGPAGAEVASEERSCPAFAAAPLCPVRTERVALSGPSRCVPA